VVDCAAAFVELLDERYAELATEFKLNDTGQGSLGFIGLD
jgi:hypothetical protein